MPGCFPVCPPTSGRQIWGVPRLYPLLAAALIAVAPVRAAADDLSRFSRVAVEPCTAFVYIATVKMTILPFARKNTVYSSTYSARVFPYFYYSEAGRIWIVVSDDQLRRVARGESIDFSGRAISESGESRKVDGHATLTRPSGGRIRVRVFVSRRISLDYDTTFELVGAASPGTPVTPR